MRKIIGKINFQATVFDFRRVFCGAFLMAICIFLSASFCFAQPSKELELNLDVKSNTIPLPGVFKPNIDLSGRGAYEQASWPQELAASEVLDTWQKDIGFNGIYRIQYNLWEIYELAKYKETQDKLLANYEEIIKKISDAGGIVILDIFGTPAGLGKILDKKSPFFDYRSFKALIKSHMKNLSCEKRYNVWYEAWNAPDLDDFFLGRKQEYLNLYRAIAESAKELEMETKIHIPVGGPSISWWFQNLDGNTIVNPDRSLIYELIKFCYSYRLPLDFISWHAYSTDSKAEKEVTRYNKTAVALIRDWLSYFRFDKNTRLIIDEWNYDPGANLSEARGEKAFIASSYIVSRIKNMYDAGIDYQLYFALEDFYNEKEDIIRNVGIFWFDRGSSKYKGGPKSIYNIFRMLSGLGNKMFFSLKLDDEFVGAIATKTPDGVAIVLYNYIDPEIAMGYISKNVARLNEKERRVVLSLVKRDMLTKIMRHELAIANLRVSKRVRVLLQKALELSEVSQEFKTLPRNVKLNFKNLQGSYSYTKYTVDASCSVNCDFVPSEEKFVKAAGAYQETIALKPYSVSMIILKNTPDGGPKENPDKPIDKATEKPVEKAVDKPQEKATDKPGAGG